MLTEKEKYLNWIEEEKKKGLKSIHFSTVDGAKFDNEEEIYRELNAMVNGKEVPISDLL
jgi:hypothetical protein